MLSSALNFLLNMQSGTRISFFSNFDIISVEDTKINDALDFADLIYDYKIGDSVILTVVSDGEQKEVTLQIQSK